MREMKILIAVALAASTLFIGAMAQDRSPAEMGKARMGTAIGTEDDPVTAPVPAGEGNLPAGFYPQSPCAKPQAMGRPPEPSNQAAMQAYNAKVKAFNLKAVTFNACMKTYVDRARNDVKAIEDTVHAAVANANH
jgi:hypothetical protein